MHELGIVFHIIDSLEVIGKKENLTNISKVTLEIGEVSGVVDHYLTDCWRWAADKSALMQGAQLEIEQIDAVTLCEDCNQEYETVKYGRVCPFCESEATHLITGNEVNIKEIEV